MLGVIRISMISSGNEDPNLFGSGTFRTSGSGIYYYLDPYRIYLFPRYDLQNLCTFISLTIPYYDIIPGSSFSFFWLNGQCQWSDLEYIIPGPRHCHLHIACDSSLPVAGSVADPWHFGMDPDQDRRWILQQKLIFSSFFLLIAFWRHPYVYIIFQR